jgi:hypothetical protein
MVTEFANDKLHLDLLGKDKDSTKKDRRIFNDSNRAEYWQSI